VEDEGSPAEPVVSGANLRYGFALLSPFTSSSLTPLHLILPHTTFSPPPSHPFTSSSLTPLSLLLSHRYGFLLEDYKLVMPMALWEWIELVRKLCLSVVGAFWSERKGTMCVATALFISAFFFALHLRYYPFKSDACNRLQVSRHSSAFISPDPYTY
jgi:hypothetical protein